MFFISMLTLLPICPPFPYTTLFRSQVAVGTLALDAAVNISEGYGSRNREAYAPVLLEMAGVPMLGSDALSLSRSEEHTSELQSPCNLVCRLLLDRQNTTRNSIK